MIKVLGIDLAREGANNFPNSTGFQQRRKPSFAISRIVVHYRKVAGTLRYQPVDQLLGHPGRAESANHYGGPVKYAGHRIAN
jgi:hypothetical protein